MRLTAALPSVAVSLAMLAGGWLHAGEDEQPSVLKVSRVETLTGDQQAKISGSLISLEVNEKPLKQVLDYLSTVSGKNIRVRKTKDERLLVSFKLENVTYTAILDFIARKYGMIVDNAMISQNVIFLDTPEKVSMVFNNADIRDVINTIAVQSNANIVIGPEVQGNVTMRLENVPWKDALNIVVRTLDFVAVDEPNNTIRITTPAKIATQLDIRIFRLSYISPEGSKYTAVLTSDFTKREEAGAGGGGAGGGGGLGGQGVGQSLLDVLNKIKSSGGTISYEKRTNSVIVQDTATALDKIQIIIDKLDLPPKQVHVSVKLVELTDNDAERLGVDWTNGLRFNVSPPSNWVSSFPFDISNGLSRSLLGDLSVTSGVRRVFDPTSPGTPIGVSDLFTIRRGVMQQNGGVSLSSGGIVQTASGGGGTQADLITLGSMGFNSTTALLEMIKTRTRGRVIQSPQLIALDNEEATIQVGSLLRYAETIVANTEGGGNVGGFREAAGSPLKLGFQLLVIPHVTGPENNVLMTIIPKTENLVNFETFGDLRLPQTTQSIVVTKMMLRNGETGVIGGLKEEFEDLQERKVPVFGDIPFIGRLFRHRSKSNRGRNLMVFVTPTIIDFYAQDEFKKDLDKIRNDYSKPFTPLGDEEETAQR